MAARTSSAERNALVESAPATARVSDYLQRWKVRFAGTDWVPWLILALAAFLRLFLLGIKPPHFDEGINGWFVDQVMKNGFYRYDPTNYHGPLHFYVLLLFQSLFGRNVWALRMPIVLVSIACVWLALKFEPLVGRNVSRIAALAMAVSPGFVFYGRYAIHEVWLQFFSMIFILGLLGLWRRGTLTYLWYAGVGLTGMILTKETYAIHVACALLAIPTLAVSYALNRVPDAKPAKQTWSWIDLAMIVIVGGFAIVFFYSGTFFNWSGVKGLYLAFKAWTETGAAGHGHEKAWDYWLGLMMPHFEIKRADFFGYELPMLAGLILCVFCQKLKNLSLRYLAIYGVGSLVAYSIVKYKTPWCIISFGWPLLFIFGAAILLVRPKICVKVYVTIGVLLCISLGSSHLAELFQVFFARGAVRVRPDVQRHIQINETASNAGEARSLQLSPHRTSDPLERLSASLGVGRFRSGRLLRRRKHARQSRWRFSPCAARQNKRRRIKIEGHVLHRHDDAS